MRRAPEETSGSAPEDGSRSRSDAATADAGLEDPADGPVSEPDGAVEAAEPEAEPDWEDLAKRKAAELENFRKQAALRVQKASGTACGASRSRSCRRSTTSSGRWPTPRPRRATPSTT